MHSIKNMYTVETAQKNDDFCFFFNIIVLKIEFAGIQLHFLYIVNWSHGMAEHLLYNSLK